MIMNETLKIELKQRNLVKACYGTDEWSENSGICCQCKWKDDCGKMNSRRLKHKD